jgi:hypothetical protein
VRGGDARRGAVILAGPFGKNLEQRTFVKEGKKKKRQNEPTPQGRQRDDAWSSAVDDVV